MLSFNWAKPFTLATVRDRPNMMADRDTSDVCETELSGLTEPLGSDEDEAGVQRGGRGARVCRWSRVEPHRYSDNCPLYSLGVKD